VREGFGVLLVVAALASAGCGRSVRTLADANGNAPPEAPSAAAKGNCFVAPNVIRDSPEDLASLALPREVAPGSAAAPLPFEMVTERLGSELCRDGTGAIWSASRLGVARYDANLSKTFAAEQSAEYWACTAEGLVAASSSETPPYETTVTWFGAEGLARETRLEVSSAPYGLRAEPFGTVLLFPTSPVTIDGVEYTRTALGGATHASSAGLYWLEAEDDAKRMRWLSANGFDARGGYYSMTFTGSSDGARIERYAADGELLAQTHVPGDGLSSRAWRVLPDGGMVALLEGSLTLEHEDSPQRLGYPRAFVLRVDEDGVIRWVRAFGGPGDEYVLGISVLDDGSVWAIGRFHDWLEVGRRAVFGHVGSFYMTTPSGWNHRFLARIEADGVLSALGALGEAANDDFRLQGLDADRALFSGSFPGETVGAAQFGPEGELPANFSGVLSAASFPPLPLPELPEETLPELPLDEGGGAVTSVELSGDGRSYVVRNDGEGARTFEYALSGEVLPPFPAFESHAYPSHALHENEFLFVDSSAPAAQSVRRFLRVRDGWEEVPSLGVDSTSASPCAGIFALNGWLFVPCEAVTHAFRRAGSEWAFVSKALRYGHAVAFDGRTLVIGNVNEFDKRDGAGAAYVYAVNGNGFEELAKLLASDSLEYDPGIGCIGDVCYGPPRGNGFGAYVDVSGDHILVGNNAQNYYGFQRSTGAREQWKQEFGGVARYRGDSLLVTTPEPRGRTYYSGSLLVYEREGGSWVERQRIVPAQRWESQFGAWAPSAGGGILVAAPGYGRPNSSGTTPPGKVFVLEPAACPAP
jgi:hypothetical protein